MATSRPFLGEPAPFLQAFPAVAEIVVQVSETGDIPSAFASHGLYPRRFHNNELGSLVSCSNPRCRQGGIDLRDQIYFLVESRETRREFSCGCNGHEGSPKGRRKGDPCDNRFQIHISIAYKENS